ncbi:glycosyltransferase family 2 protein [Actinokineospora bangkokensis]|uniref:Galactosyltransferase C-terminal domain-containing protein n=1 Tax=Actinokineospora bangkokensis TaxID=1193682 RepID=A0A1Q9LMP9_9PSEU|nr:galactosyltransferase-related protein [Actinokineospora bangkokensis]OLR93264.1 hypothetical protein BJP25_17425 [Actinokineospora bangkokensis]
MTPRTAVVTITHGRHDHLRNQCLGLALDPPDQHVVVLMGDDPEPDLPRSGPRTLVRVPAVPDTGLPLAAARNLGARTALDAGADVLVFLDVDCVPGADLTTRYRTAVAGLAEPALVCGPVTYLPPPPPGGYPVTRLAGWTDPHPARPAPPDGQVVAEQRWELFWSLSFALSADTWWRVGGFSELYTGYGAEDTDFALSAHAVDVRLLWLGGAHAYHQHHPPTRHRPGVVEQMVRNAHTFHSRWHRWPMVGWFEDLAARRVVDFDPAAGTLRVRR